MLVGNHTPLNKSPGRTLGGSTISECRGAWNKGGMNRCRFMSVAAYSRLAATPNGHLGPSAWVLPITGGAMSAYRSVSGTGTLTVQIAGGVNGSAALTGVGTVSGVAQLIAVAAAALSGTGTINGSPSALGQVLGALAGSGTLTATASFTTTLAAVAALTGSGTLAATISAITHADMSAALAGSGTVAATWSALARVAAALTGNGTLAGTPRASGSLVANITPFTDLSPQSLATSVWNAVAAEVNAAGTTGEALNLALAILRNKTVTDPTAGTITVYEPDGTTVLLVADLFEDAAGTSPYAGSGAERRERLT